MRVWPSLHAAHVSTKAPVFTKSLFGVAAAGQQHRSTGASSATTDGGADATTLVTQQPPSPPLSDTQRDAAARALARSRTLAQQHRLGRSSQLDVLALPPMPLYEQFRRGVGVYAGRASLASCQTGQLHQDVQEQDVQTDEVRACRAGVWVVRRLASAPPCKLSVHVMLPAG